jgi:homoserine kinase
MHRRRAIRVPASSANLGPGFDSMAAALALHLELDVEETGEFGVETDVPGIPTDRTNLVVRAFESLAPADGFTFRVRSQIPPVAGLGSSAAAAVAGVVAADHIFELDADLLAAATALEGHPDNAAAALRGGFVICHEEGAERFEAAPGLEAVVAIPPEQVSTAAARAALPAEVPFTDAVHNAAHAAMLVLGLSRADLDLVARGLADRLHQPRRAHLYPRSIELLGRAREFGAVGASISGAGPTVLFWSHWEATGQLVARLSEEAPSWEIRRVAFEPEGATVRALV